MRSAAGKTSDEVLSTEFREIPVTGRRGVGRGRTQLRLIAKVKTRSHHDEVLALLRASD